MSDDENQPQNPTSEENLSPTSPQEPTEPAPINTIDSEPYEALPGALESSPNDFWVKSTDIPPPDSTLSKPEKTQENQGESEPATEPVSGLKETPESEKPQIPVNEPLETEPEKEKPRVSYLKFQKAKELLVMARNAIQFRKRKKLDRVMNLFLKQSKITNDEVEKLLHVSDATATRYLSQLEKEGKIKQNGKTGHMVSYSRI